MVEERGPDIPQGFPGKTIVSCSGASKEGNREAKRKRRDDNFRGPRMENQPKPSMELQKDGRSGNTVRQYPHFNPAKYDIPVKVRGILATFL